MSTLVERLAERYSADQQQFIVATSRHDALQYLDQLRAVVERMEEFDRFPEGSVGVVIHTLLTVEAGGCPDAGDFGYVLQGVKKIVEVSGAELLSAARKDNMW